jgi:hypothetical protein
LVLHPSQTFGNFLEEQEKNYLKCEKATGVLVALSKAIINLAESSCISFFFCCNTITIMKGPNQPEIHSNPMSSHICAQIVSHYVSNLQWLHICFEEGEQPFKQFSRQLANWIEF